MLKFNTDELDDLVKKIDRMQDKLERGKKMWFHYLTTNSKINIQNKLIGKIQDLVYDSNEPDHYERTKNLLKATRLSVEGDRVVLYMDDEWLASTEHGNISDSEMDMSTGTAPETHDSEGYSWAVEHDHVYNNDYNHPYKRDGSHYMKKTFEEIDRQIDNGTITVEALLNPLFREWKK